MNRFAAEGELDGPHTHKQSPDRVHEDIYIDNATQSAAQLNRNQNQPEEEDSSLGHLRNMLTMERKVCAFLQDEPLK